MLAAEPSISKNPCEYILYTWQIEDLLRALQFDLNKLEQVLLAAPDAEEVKVRRELTRFSLFINEMKLEGILEKGHLAKSYRLMAELIHLHNELVEREPGYLEIYQKAQADIKAYIEKTDNQKQHHIEACFNALYGLLVLRLKKQKISKATEEAMSNFSALLAHLAHYYSN